MAETSIPAPTTNLAPRVGPFWTHWAQQSLNALGGIAGTMRPMPAPPSAVRPAPRNLGMVAIPQIPPGSDLYSSEGRRAAMNTTYNAVRRDMMAQIESDRQNSNAFLDIGGPEGVLSARATRANESEIERLQNILGAFVYAGRLSEEDASTIIAHVNSCGDQGGLVQRRFAESLLRALGGGRQLGRSLTTPLGRDHLSLETIKKPTIPKRTPCLCFEGDKEGPCLCHVDGRRRHIHM